MYFCRKVFLYLFFVFLLSYLLLCPSTPKVMFGLTTMPSCRPIFGICLMSSFTWRVFRNFSGLLLLGSEGILLQISFIIPSSSFPLFSARSMSNPHKPLRFTSTIMAGELNKFVSTDYNYYGPLISSIHNIHSFFCVLLNFFFIASIYIKFMC